MNQVPINWQSCAKSDVGLVRSVNEDAFLERGELGLWVVADGLGGHAVGDVASRMIVEALSELNTDARLSEFVDVVEETLIEVNGRIIDYSDVMFDSATMGSTVVSLVIRGSVGVCLWAGDSRLYRLRDGHLSRLSRDHSHVQELIEMGVLEPEEAENHPRANVITRAIGVDSNLLLDINLFNAQEDDVFLLCSDGLQNTVDEEVIADILSKQDVMQSCDTLVDLSLDNGAPDNVTVIVVKGTRGS